MQRKQVSVLMVIGKIAMRILVTGLVLIFGFWLIMASNMGPAYLPEVCDSCLDMWIRMTLLAAGLLIWLTTIIWLVWTVLSTTYQLFKHSK